MHHFLSTRINIKYILELIRFPARKRLHIVTVTIFKDDLIVTVTTLRKYVIVTVTMFKQHVIVTFSNTL